MPQAEELREAQAPYEVDALRTCVAELAARRWAADDSVSPWDSISNAGDNGRRDGMVWHPFDPPPTCAAAGAERAGWRAERAREVAWRLDGLDHGSRAETAAGGAAAAAAAAAEGHPHDAAAVSADRPTRAKLVEASPTPAKLLELRAQAAILEGAPTGRGGGADGGDAEWRVHSAVSYVTYVT